MLRLLFIVVAVIECVYIFEGCVVLVVVVTVVCGELGIRWFSRFALELQFWGRGGDASVKECTKLVELRICKRVKGAPYLEL